jgi:ubiquinone/menaquinone biosynthesis C-methylase UbiE
MGLIFDKKAADGYDAWLRSSQGRAMEGFVENVCPTLLDPKPGERILDIGCGAGNHLAIFKKMGLDVNGIDASGYMIQRANQRLGQGCFLEVGMAESLPYEDNSFDLAVFVNSLEFMDNPLLALREAGRVANRKVFVGVINSLSLNGLLRRFKGLWVSSPFRHAKFYHFWQIQSLLRTAYGPAPISWECVKVRPSFPERWIPGKKFPQLVRRSPFCFFLGFSVKIVYRVKTDNLPLKIKLNKAPNSLVSARTMEDLRRSSEEEKNERGLSVQQAER